MSHIILDGNPGCTAYLRGKEYLFFSGYAYLGLQHVPAFAALVKKGMDKYGWLFPSARMSNTRIALFEECEQLLSSITGCEETVLVSSGYTAGRLATAQWSDDIINLAPSHPAIKRNNIQSTAGVYAVDSVNILTAEVTDVTAQLQGKTVDTVIIDDSHGTGLSGNRGQGTAGYIERQPGVDYIFTYSLSKAWGINAGAISCSPGIAAAYRAQPAFTAATAPSPALLYAFIKGQEIYAQQREKLQQNIQYFHTLISPLNGVRCHPMLPMFVLPPGIYDEALFNKGIIISSFAYPDPKGPKINRVVLNALHTKNDLEYLAECLLKG